MSSSRSRCIYGRCAGSSCGAGHPDHVELADAIAWRAVATSGILAAWKVGKFVAARSRGEVQMRELAMP